LNAGNEWPIGTPQARNEGHVFPFFGQQVKQKPPDVSRPCVEPLRKKVRDRRFMEITLCGDPYLFYNPATRGGPPMFSVLEIIELAIRIEENGEKVYRRAVQDNPNAPLAPLLTWFVEEEVRHVEWLMQLKKGVRKDVDDPDILELGMSILRGILGEKTFSLEEADFSKMEKREDLLEAAMEFEKDTLMFYRMLEPLVEDPEGFLNRIIQEEQRHINALEDCMEKRGNSPSPVCR
jgi:rubrerythrin